MSTFSKRLEINLEKVKELIKNRIKMKNLKNNMKIMKRMKLIHFLKQNKMKIIKKKMKKFIQILRK